MTNYNIPGLHMALKLMSITYEVQLIKNFMHTLRLVIPLFYNSIYFYSVE
jgi:hypothetical protein